MHLQGSQSPLNEVLALNKRRTKFIALKQGQPEDEADEKVPKGDKTD